MISETLLAEARAYSDRIAVRMANRVEDREEISTGAFLAYLQGFKAGLDYARTVAHETFAEVRRDG